MVYVLHRTTAQAWVPCGSCHNEVFTCGSCFINWPTVWEPVIKCSVAGADEVLTASEMAWYRTGLSLWIFFGLGWLSTLLNAIRSMVQVSQITPHSLVVNSQTGVHEVQGDKGVASVTNATTHNCGSNAGPKNYGSYTSMLLFVVVCHDEKQADGGSWVQTENRRTAPRGLRKVSASKGEKSEMKAQTPNRKRLLNSHGLTTLCTKLSDAKSSRDFNTAVIQCPFQERKHAKENSRRMPPVSAIRVWNNTFIARLTRKSKKSGSFLKAFTEHLCGNDFCMWKEANIRKGSKFSTRTSSQHAGPGMIELIAFIIPLSVSQSITSNLQVHSESDSSIFSGAGITLPACTLKPKLPHLHSDHRLCQTYQNRVFSGDLKITFWQGIQISGARASGQVLGTNFGFNGLFVVFISRGSELILVCSCICLPTSCPGELRHCQGTPLLPCRWKYFSTQTISDSTLSELPYCLSMVTELGNLDIVQIRGNLDIVWVRGNLDNVRVTPPATSEKYFNLDNVWLGYCLS